MANMQSTQTQSDVPSWVQTDAACRHAWQHDRQWRRRARYAAPPVHKPLNDGGTSGDHLLVQARRDYARAHARSAPPAPQAHHAAECPCNPCRRKRGEKALPTLRQQQESRKRALGIEPGDREEWLLTAHDAVRWTRVVDMDRDPRDKITTCELRPEWLGHLDGLLRKDALELLWQAHPHLARAFTGCAMDGRTQENVATAEGVSRATISRRVAQAREFLAQRLGA